ncbi:Hypothetical predicted protein, partial [Mytilus galloprovincialis]
MPPKKKSFNEVCNNFTEACSDLSDKMEAGDPTTDLLNLLRATTEGNQGLNESDITAVKVIKLLLPAVSVISSRMVNMTSEAQNVKIDKLTASVRLNRYAIDDQNQYSRRENIRIFGIPENEGENLIDIIKDLCKAMKVTVKDSDIVICHRIGSKGQGPSSKPRIIMLRSSRDLKVNMFTNKKLLKDNPVYKSIFINEDLTSMRFKLFQFVKKIETVKSVFTRDGKIHCLTKNNSKFVIESPDDLFKIGVDHVDYSLFGMGDLDYVCDEGRDGIPCINDGNSVENASVSFYNNVKSDINSVIKILSLNVCGIKSKLKAPDLEELCANYDVLCFCESKLDQYDDIEIENFKALPPLNRSNAKCKSGGIIVFVRENIYENVKVLHSSCENVLWFAVNDVLYKNVLFGSVYIPPENSNYSKIDIFDVIEADLIRHTAEKDYNVCLLGDFNARTGIKSDFTLLDGYVCNSVQLEDIVDVVNLENFDVKTSRYNFDKNVNNYGNRLLQLCKNFEILIANGRLGTDKEKGALTCKNCSTVDYCILSPNLFSFVSDFHILPFDHMISDVHNALHIELLCNPIVTCDIENFDKNNIVKPKWDNNNCQLFNDALNADNINDLYERLDSLDVTSVTKDMINDFVVECNDIIIHAATDSNMLKEINVSEKKCRKKPKCKVNKPWFKADCKRKRSDYHKAKCYNWRVKTVDSMNNLVRCSKNYKKVLNCQYNEYRRNFVKKLRNLSLNDPKSYWTLLNRSGNCNGKNKVLEKVSNECFFEHFKKLSNAQEDNDCDFVDVDRNTVTNLNINVNAVITEKEVENAIKNLKNNKSC